MPKPGILHSRTQSGFTIVELLIVIVVIGILAAITIVAFNGVQDKAKQSAAQSALTQANKKVIAYAAQNSDTYPPNLATADVTNTTGLQYSYNNTSSPKTYGITATNGKYSYYVSNVTSQPASGGYAGHGQGGVATITNLATNPGLENDTSNWTNRWFGPSGAGTVTRSSAGAQSGSNGLRKTWTTAGGGQDIGYQYILTDVVPAKTYTFSVYVRTSVVTKHKIFIQWANASTASTGATGTGSEITVPTNTWQRLSLTATAPADTAQATLIWGPYPESGSPTYGVGQTIDSDSLMITEGSTLQTYADGDSAKWAWTGTPNVSTSTGMPL